MLVVKNIQNVSEPEGEWFERTIWGATIGFKIRPRTEKAMEAINNKFKALREGPKKAAASSDAYYDYILEDFDGIADELPDGTLKPWEKTLENKKKLLFMKLPFNEPPIYEWVIDKANGLGFTTQEEEIKN
jgi:hypothetical protein